MGIGIDQDLLRIEAPAFLWFPWSVDAISVSITNLDPREMAMPYRSLAMGERETTLVTFLVDERDLDRIGCRSPESEVDTTCHRM
jgi:hypothetical protein